MVIRLESSVKQIFYLGGITMSAGHVRMDWITCAEAASKRQVTRQTIWRWACEMGLIARRQVGRVLLVSEQDVMTVEAPKKGNPLKSGGRGIRSADKLSKAEQAKKLALEAVFLPEYPYLYAELEQQKRGYFAVTFWEDRTKNRTLGTYPLADDAPLAGIDLNQKKVAKKKT